MGANLMWEPKTRSAKSLPDELKFVLRDKCDLGDDRITFNRSNISYLRGLADAGINGAMELITILEKHEEVELWLEY